MLDFIKKHMGWITLIVILGAFAAPAIFTMSGFECFNKTTTGQIGDTIGGTTAPFWGFLSVILLYFTFKEQQAFNNEQLRFNKTQQTASDYDILMKLRDNISYLSNNLEINITVQGICEKKYYEGTSHIDKLQKSKHRNNSIGIEDFEKLYKSAIEIAELCLLYINLLKQSSLGNELKKAFLKPISIHLEAILRLFVLYQQENIGIDGTKNEIDDLFARYAEKNKDLISQFKNN